MKRTLFLFCFLLNVFSFLQAQPSFLGLTEQGAGYGAISKYDATTNTINLAHSFNLKGANPNGKMIKATDGKLYGMTTEGGASGHGVIFSFDPATSNYTVLKNFNKTDGANPHGSLFQASDGKLYGMTYQGGSANAGVIFSFDILTLNYTVLKNFDLTNGGHPEGSFIQATNGKLYATIGIGDGAIFSFDPLTSVYTRIKIFTHWDGGEPYGDLVQASDGKLYGMTSRGGGTYNSGVLFSYDIITSTYTVRKTFIHPHGVAPHGSLIQASDGRLYGMTNLGGTSNVGVIFYFNPFTNDFAVIKNFNNTDGARPYGSLIQAGNGKLYGLTSVGGSSYFDFYKPGYGVIFSIDPSTFAYTVLKNLDSINGGPSYSNDLLAGLDGKLYGMTHSGGINNRGVIFSFNQSTTAYTKLVDISNTNASSPQGTLCKASNGKYYGMTYQGGG